MTRPARSAPLTDAEAWRLTDLVGASYVALADVASGAARPHGITLAELVALAILAQHPDGLGQASWGRLQGVSRQRAHVVATQLADRGLVRIERIGRDSLVRFTRAGLRLLERLRPDVGGALAAALGEMPPSHARSLGPLLEELLASVGGQRRAPA